MNKTTLFTDTTAPEKVTPVRVTEFKPLAGLLRLTSERTMVYKQGEDGTPQITTTFDPRDSSFNVIYRNPTCVANLMGKERTIVISGRLNEHEKSEFYLEGYVKLFSVKIDNDINHFPELDEVYQLLGKMENWWNNELATHAPIHKKKIDEAFKQLNAN